MPIYAFLTFDPTITLLHAEDSDLPFEDAADEFMENKWTCPLDTEHFMVRRVIKYLHEYVDDCCLVFSDEAQKLFSLEGAAHVCVMQLAAGAAMPKDWSDLVDVQTDEVAWRRVDTLPESGEPESMEQMAELLPHAMKALQDSYDELKDSIEKDASTRAENFATLLFARAMGNENEYMDPVVAREFLHDFIEKLPPEQRDAKRKIFKEAVHHMTKSMGFVLRQSFDKMRGLPRIRHHAATRLKKESDFSTYAQEFALTAAVHTYEQRDCRISRKGEFIA